MVAQGSLAKVEAVGQGAPRTVEAREAAEAAEVRQAPPVGEAVQVHPCCRLIQTSSYTT